MEYEKGPVIVYICVYYEVDTLGEAKDWKYSDCNGQQLQ